ncbi:MAG: GNAT family N-acetyltransferase [Thermoplasmata archaeon]|nr:GNAT family N-acetyltransferase [Thermoplasmata archaeon]
MADTDQLERALREEREFVLTLGGFALEIPGATLVTHERVPVPRFNFVQDVRVGPGRQAAFFERALDHYFQRTLRPSVRIGEPVPAHLDSGLRRFGFRRRGEPHTVLLHARVGGPRAPGGFEIRRARPEEVDSLVRFWTGEAEGDEFRRSLTVAWEHPNPGESLRPLLAERDGVVVAAALIYETERTVGLHAVSTQPSARGQGAATALVAHALAAEIPPSAEVVTISSENERTERRLNSLGFAAARRYAVYELPPSASLQMPDPGPPPPPRWRPPRRPSA